MLKKKDGMWLDTAIKSRKSNVEQLKLIRKQLKKAYKCYKSFIKGTTLKLPKSSLIGHKDLLVDYYEHPPAKLSAELKARRNDHCLNECPSCGNPLSPDTLDHFIPKDDWPEFSIFPNNLVPQCRECAPKKNSRYYCDKDKFAMFIHPIYFDLLSKIGFRVQAQLKDKKPEFTVEFVKLGELSETEIARVKKHLAELDVKSRFTHYCHKEYLRWKRKIVANKFDIRDALTRRIRELPDEGDFSRDWKTAFNKGVLSCEAMINHLNQQTPKEKIIVKIKTEVLD